MPTDPTPERVREIAERPFEVVPADGLPGVNTQRRLSNEKIALARQVIALREIAEDAVSKVERIGAGKVDGILYPNPRISARLLRARLDALGGG